MPPDTPSDQHSCPYVGDIAVLNNAIPEMKSDIKEILDTIKGNGKVGLRTDLEVLKSRVRIAFYLFSLVGVAIVKIAFF